MEIGPKDNSLIMRLLDAASMRQNVIGHNVANQNTPAFTREVVRFEDLLRGALERGESIENVQPIVEGDFNSPRRADGNNVNMELELGALRENRILYESYAAMLGGRFDLIRTAIESGR